MCFADGYAVSALNAGVEFLFNMREFRYLHRSTSIEWVRDVRGDNWRAVDYERDMVRAY